MNGNLKCFLLSTIGLACYSIADSSYAGSCAPAAGPHTYTYSANFNANQNHVGYTTNWQEFNRSDGYSLPAPCNRGNNTFITLKPSSGLTEGSRDGDTVWYNIPGNDYLQVAMKVWIGGFRSKWVSIPVTAMSNLCNSNDCTPQYSSGSKVQVRLRIKKKFVGQSFVLDREVGQILMATSAGDVPNKPVAIIRLAATMTVPQSCTFDVGNVIEFDFGRIQAGAFESAGAGNRPEGTPIMTKNIGVECKNIEAQQLLSARVEATNPKNNILVSNNPNVGFQMLDKDDKVLKINTINSYIPFRLDNNARGRFTIKAVPVSVTGVKPQPGFVNAQGHVRIDFQ
ncbi:fimbrial protein [Acinetobacter larvae]|uniref:Fimbrial-type adhesion domain-containing protein n=1 Tax=Acinetobacter larvae TaxID=1789224 RepID=A0A1B2M1B0_9GAMM|nr:fimbrial protein [Acinetobacter larvae]AOA58984.1 hypothetical protein BFG52_11900 [Acinetobacter larvae]